MTLALDDIGLLPLNPVNIIILPIATSPQSVDNSSFNFGIKSSSHQSNIEVGNSEATGGIGVNGGGHTELYEEEEKGKYQGLSKRRSPE